MNLLFWAVIGLVVGYFVGRTRGISRPTAFIGLVGAIIGGLVGNQLWGSNPIPFTWDFVHNGQAMVAVLTAPSLDVVGALVGAALSSIGLIAVTPPTSRPTTSA